jgi:uncharacterized protein YwqG
MHDKRILDVIEATARENAAERLAVDALVRRLLPSVRLIPQNPSTDAGPRLGGCRIGGCPDLPAKVNWPRLSTAWKLDPEELDDADDPLPFLMQINLAETAPFDPADALPKESMLYFFFYWEDDYPGEGDTAFVLHSPSASPLRRSTPPHALPQERLFRGLDLLPKLEWTVPSINDVGLHEAVIGRHYRFWDDVFERVAEVQGVEPANGGGVAHRLLGHAQFIQSPGMADGTRLLLQVDSDCREEHYPHTGMTWGDSGRIYYRLSDEELRRHDFGAADAVMEMC